MFFDMKKKVAKNIFFHENFPKGELFRVPL